MDFFDLFEEKKELAKDIWTSPYHLIDLTQFSMHHKVSQKVMLFCYFLVIFKNICYLYFVDYVWFFLFFPFFVI